MKKSSSVNIHVTGGSVSIGDGANIGNIVEGANAAARDFQMRLPPEIEPFDVFVSYSQRDRAIVDRIVRALQKAGLKVWYDQELEASSAFVSEINERLGAAPAILVIWSRHSAASEWVLNEAEIARQRNVLVGVRIDDIIPPAPFVLRQALTLGVPESGEVDIPDSIKAGLTALVDAASREK